MQFLYDGIIALFLGYLSFTNLLAGQISNIIGDTTITPTSVVASDPGGPTLLPSLFHSATLIPDVLLRSTDFQAAAVVESDLQQKITTDNPFEALVNVYCTFTTAKNIRTTTGTGFFIDQGGIILTNAHVAQFLLLEKTNKLGKTDCVIRNGNPAAPRYHAELLYISPAWIKANATLIDAVAPVGTGERDYALLYVTDALDESPLPAVFPALRVNESLLPRTTEESTVVAAAYPAGALLTGGTDTALMPRLATTTVSQLFTYTSNYADVMGMRGSSVGEQGSSGGPVLALDHQVIGMITTRGNDTNDGAGSLRAITMSHINRTITEETGFSLTSNISGNIPYRAEVFTNTMAPFLTTLLANEL
jgi:S1-C subfamily serine protease